MLAIWAHMWQVLMELSSFTDNICDIHSIQWHSCQTGEKTYEPMFAAEITFFSGQFQIVGVINIVNLTHGLRSRWWISKMLFWAVVYVLVCVNVNIYDSTAVQDISFATQVFRRCMLIALFCLKAIITWYQSMQQASSLHLHILNKVHTNPNVS